MTRYCRLYPYVLPVCKVAGCWMAYLPLMMSQSYQYDQYRQVHANVSSLRTVGTRYHPLHVSCFNIAYIASLFRCQGGPH